MSTTEAIGSVNVLGSTLRLHDARHWSRFSAGDRLRLSSSHEGPPRHGHVTVTKVETHGVVHCDERITSAIVAACDNDVVCIETLDSPQYAEQLLAIVRAGLGEALEQIRFHNEEYEHRTSPEVIARLRGLL